MKAKRPAKAAKSVERKKPTQENSSTEEKIKNAARTVFHRKGFAATRTRDIADEAGINLALLNYYFRSKENLFELIMLETLHGFIKYLLDIFNDTSISLENKIETFAEKHIDLLLHNPGLPLFMLSELKANPQLLASKIGNLELIGQSHFMQQFRKAVKDKKIANINPMHLIMNMLSMTTFPFIATPLLKGMGELTDKGFNDLILERKKMIPIWMKAMLSIK